MIFLVVAEFFVFHLHLIIKEGKMEIAEFTTQIYGDCRVCHRIVGDCYDLVKKFFCRKIHVERK